MGIVEDTYLKSVESLPFYPMYTHLYIHCRYHELFFMIDTCQAESMFQKLYSPNILAVASSHVGEDSLSVSMAWKRFIIRIMEQMLAIVP